MEARHSLLPAGNIGNIQFLAAMFVGWDIDWTSNQGSRLPCSVTLCHCLYTLKMAPTMKTVTRMAIRKARACLP